MLGSADFWTRIAGEAPPHASFVQDATTVLQREQIRVAEITTAVETLEYADSYGHPSKAARVELAALLMATFEELTQLRLQPDAPSTSMTDAVENSASA